MNNLETYAEDRRKNQSSAEKIFQNSQAFYYFGKEMQPEYLVRINGESFFLDFYVETEAGKIAIEIDGYEHTKLGAPENDRRRDKLLAEVYGILTFRIPAKHIYEGWVNLRYMQQLLANFPSLQPQISGK